MRARTVTLIAVLALLSLLSSRAYAVGDVRLSIHDGRVTLSARDATLHDILSAWAREGGTAIVNLDRVTFATPMTIELNDVEEEDALAVLLRPLSGYLTVARASGDAGVSRFDRIVLLPTSVANHDSTVLNTPVPPPIAAPPHAAPAQQTLMINGVARLVRPNGTVVEDDQQDAPPANAPRGFTRGDDPGPAPAPARSPAQTPSTQPTGASAPGVVIAPPPPSAAQPPVQR